MAGRKCWTGKLRVAMVRRNQGTAMRLDGWITVSVAAAAITLGGLACASTPDEVVAARRTTMKSMGDIGKAFDDAVSNEADVAPLAPQTRRLAELGHDIPAMFPPGTETAGETRAWREVWTERPAFERAAARFVADSAKLAPLAAAGDKDGFSAQWEVVGNDCAGCHHAFKRH